MKLKRNILILTILNSIAVNAATPITTKYTLEREENNKQNTKENNLVLPYFFSTDSMGFNLGVGGVSQGYDQEQMAIGGTVYSGGSDSYGLYAGLWNYRIPKTENLYLTAQGFHGYYPEQTSYGTNGSIGFPTNQPFPGSNNSSKDQYLRGEGSSSFLDLKLEYVFPIGLAKESSIVNTHRHE